MYITPEVPDPDAGEFNPGAIHFFDISGYVPGEFPVEFDGLWESLNMTVSARLRRITRCLARPVKRWT